MKTCHRCGEIKSPTVFSIDRRKSDGLRFTCKTCDAIGARKSYQRLRNRKAVIPASEQVCQTCKVFKPGDEFYTHKGKKSGLSSACKSCDSRRKRRTKYGLTNEQLDIVDASTVCDICGIDRADSARTVVDHDHKTGKIRGILCLNCNVALGMLKDNQETLKAAINYLENPPGITLLRDSQIDLALSLPSEDLLGL